MNHPTCGTCPFWNQKTDSRGYCINPEARAFFGVTARDFPERMNFVEILQFKRDIEFGCEVYVMKDFGCIQHPELIKILEGLP